MKLIKLAATMWLGVGLSGCVDAVVDVALTSESTAKVTMSQTMGAEFYAMVKEGAGSGDAEDSFCPPEGALSEHDDGTATCTLIDEGKFVDLDISREDNSIRFAPAGPGLVRVSVPLEDVRDELGAGEGMDDEGRAMMEAFFADSTVTIRFSGVEISETNMSLSADRRTAEQVIPFLDLIGTTPELPPEYYAVVRVQ